MDGNVSHVVHIFYVGMAHEVLSQVVEHIAATTNGAMIHIRADLLTHTLVDALGIVRTRASPCLLGNKSGCQRVHTRLLDSRTIPVGVNKAHLLVQTVQHFLLITTGCLGCYACGIRQSLSQY